MNTAQIPQLSEAAQRIIDDLVDSPQASLIVDFANRLRQSGVLANLIYATGVQIGNDSGDAVVAEVKEAYRKVTSAAREIIPAGNDSCFIPIDVTDIRQLLPYARNLHLIATIMRKDKDDLFYMMLIPNPEPLKDLVHASTL